MDSHKCVLFLVSKKIEFVAVARFMGIFGTASTAAAAKQDDVVVHGLMK